LIYLREFIPKGFPFNDAIHSQMRIIPAFLLYPPISLWAGKLTAFPSSYPTYPAHFEDAVVIGGGNLALQMVDNLHPVARNIHLISTSELSADAAVVERVACLTNLHTYIGYKVHEFTGDRSLTGIIIRKKAGAETLSLPVKGAFIAVGLEPNSSLAAPLVKLNQWREIMIQPDCSTSYPGIFAAGDVTDAFGKRIIIASGEGANAALAARQYLLNLRKAVCV